MLDDTPAIWRSFPAWLATLTLLGEVRSDDIIVHHVCDLPAWVERLLQDLGVERHHVPVFDARTPHANKIGQCSADFGTADRVVLTDVDLVFLRPLPLDDVHGAVAGKLVDAPNPPLGRLREFFHDAAVPLPDAVTGTCLDAEGCEQPFATLRVNLNGGLYVIERDLVRPLGQAWETWARWLLRRSDLSRPELFHTDQIAMALAELQVDVQQLPAAWNFPTHLGRTPTPPLPFALHHHDQLDHALAQLGAIAPVEAEAIATAVADMVARADRHGRMVG